MLVANYIYSKGWKSHTGSGDGCTGDRGVEDKAGRIHGGCGVGETRWSVVDVGGAVRLTFFFCGGSYELAGCIGYKGSYDGWWCWWCCGCGFKSAVLRVSCKGLSLDSLVLDYYQDRRLMR